MTLLTTYHLAGDVLCGGGAKESIKDRDHRRQKELTGLDGDYVQLDDDQDEFEFENDIKVKDVQ